MKKKEKRSSLKHKESKGNKIQCIKCGAPANIFYKDTWLCKKHGENWEYVDEYVELGKKRREKKWKKRYKGKSYPVQDVVQGKAERHTRSVRTEFISTGTQ